MKPLLPLGCVLLFSSAAPSPGAQDGLRTITARVWHLGDDATPEWSEAPAEPEGSGMQVAFQGRSFEGEGILFVRQRDVHNVWHIELNGVRMAQLVSGDAALNEQRYVIPEGLIQEGENLLELVGETPSDDILFGDLRYAETSLREFYSLRRTRLYASQVVRGHREPLPARFTVTDSAGQPVELFYGASPHTALRKGLVYSSSGEANVELPPGDYLVYASRGMEWSRGKTEMHIAHDSHPEARYGVELELSREVETKGFIAADTHIHTLTHSGHGDASVQERQITLVGEGVELAIATDHNHNVDYAPVQRSMGLGAYYTSVIGNEVTTPIGHFNAFPLKLGESIPPHESRDLAELLAGMRERGARAVILNHPRWPEGDAAPFASIGLDTLTGDWSGSWGSGYDAMELVNSDTREEDPLLLYRDWFALMNRGERVVAVGASDSHEVGVVVGQGRTYVKSATDDPGKLDIIACSDNIAAGRSSVSMGIYAGLFQGADSVMGELLQVAPGSLLPADLRLHAAAPGWVQPESLLLFANGQEVLRMELHAQQGEAFATEVALEPTLALARHDYWLVAVVLGAGVDEPFWPLRNDYTLASTNPVFVDVDGDGAFSSARQIAEKRVAESGTQEAAILELLNSVDGAVAAQIMRLVRQDYQAQGVERAASLKRAAALQYPKLKPWIGPMR